MLSVILLVTHNPFDGRWNHATVPWDEAAAQQSLRVESKNQDKWSLDPLTGKTCSYKSAFWLIAD